MRKKEKEMFRSSWWRKKIGCVSKLQISLMDCPCLTNLSQSLHDAKEKSSIVGKNELTAQKWKIRAKEDKKWWSIWCHELFLSLTGQNSPFLFQFERILWPCADWQKKTRNSTTLKPPFFVKQQFLWNWWVMENTKFKTRYVLGR